jgi:hypothetical protein
MSNSPWNSPSSSSEPDDLDALLSGLGRGTPPSADLRPAVDVVSALTAPATRGELRGLETALSAFRAEHGMSPTFPRGRSGSRRLRARLVVAGGAVAVAFGGASAAAFTGALPAPVQKVVHALAGGHRPASPPSPTVAYTRSTRPAPAVIASARPRIVGLCTAYRAASKHGDTRFLRSAEFRRLATAAGGTDHVASFCAAVPTRPVVTPGGRASGRPSSVPGSGRPSGLTVPTHAPSTHATHAPGTTGRPGKGKGRTQTSPPGSRPSNPHRHRGRASPSPTG